MGCAFCDKEQNFEIYETPIVKLGITKYNLPRMEFRYKGDVQEFGLFVAINYCPMCGNKLKGGWK